MASGPSCPPPPYGACTQVWQGMAPTIGSTFPAATGTTLDSSGTQVPYPPCNTSLPLGGHLLPSVKERIWRGEFVDIFHLLFREPEPALKEWEQKKEETKPKHKPVEHNWANWLSGYTVYMGVMLQVHTSKGPALVKYMDIIHRGYMDFMGNAWERYDRSFRLRASLNPALPWDRQHQELWLLIMTPSRPIMGERADSGHLISRTPAAQSSGPATVQGVQGTLPCWAFNTSGSCSRSPCRFKHECGFCGGKHASIHCQRVKGPRGGGVQETRQTGARRVEAPYRALILEKGPSPVRLPVLEHLLRDYPLRAQAQYLRQGFIFGFHIPYLGL
ncbi:uncharacterized protein LOC128345096 [Hemicordylus capensis]|uniref:uncharacterized protein LOC128345096 n=1 Tax=Hemicordylus capensis TaxID=884348 RepID=UPI0023028AC1|nr:uncharacterized protein LOC128345096 [Hemicordylus capensis]XP_053152459.1 uncharacterized protein LOC128345096 [Hemicordylus capensis]XP_053152460.1 uncharacterized protein LOC128345096 [Hemicordylus capensis]XP_053152461.1 uncharacterized protein LOC128345096 [Hemicordylus capensis]XP_053152463.1 uncharacterized protein LOC128345096 [Hemicordylus capensis]XP_053152464.1 uncharacterized protein LOC128345096 [Hemicordylus capensis]XP_053152465.1 uncharacterized protein LOC128345096 [Hemico